MIFAAILFYFAPLGLLIAYITAILVHELGHLAALLFFGSKLHGVRIEMRGFVIAHEGGLASWQSFLCSASGPFAGFIYALAISLAAKYTKSDFLGLSAGISMVLGIFNLLPALPLDGGEMLKCLISVFVGELRAESITIYCSFCVSLVLLSVGIWLTRYNEGYGIIAAAVSLIIFLLFDEGIVKRDKLR